MSIIGIDGGNSPLLNGNVYEDGVPENLAPWRTSEPPEGNVVQATERLDGDNPPEGSASSSGPERAEG